MCGFLAPKNPPVQAIPDAPQSTAPQESDPAVQQSREAARKRRQAAVGGNDTLVTGGQGLTAPASTALKNATGQ